MYSGTTLTKYSGRLLGAHQKINRVARRHLGDLPAVSNYFPSSRAIQHFEGKNGPDGIKRKSPGRDEPWHYYDPFDEDDSGLIEVIEDHYHKLVEELRSSNKERAAFEAAWLAHAIVDGLTPAHHHPFEAQLAELRGQGMETRDSIKNKLVIPGQNPYLMVRNNWRMWGPKGLFTSHGFFELGLASILAPLKLRRAQPSLSDIEHLHRIGPVEYFKHAARRIATMNLYDRYLDRGWTPSLAREVRRELAPEVTKAVCLFWFAAVVQARMETES